MGNSETRRKAAILRREQIQAKIPDKYSEKDGPLRFVADVMLGRLAKWLRIAGFDVLYFNNIDDDALISISRNENRILLTLDSRLLVRKSVEYFIFLQGQKLRDHFKQVMDAIGPSGLPKPLTRCLSCNTILSSVSRDSIRDCVPSYVFKNHFHFKTCPKCRRIYWSGTHRKSVEKILKDLVSMDRASDRRPGARDQEHH